MIMDNALTLFDYIFYRAHSYFKGRGDNVSGASSSAILSLMQFLTILDVMTLVKIVHDYSFPSTKFAFLPLALLIGVINWYRYERNFEIEKLKSKWKDESPKRKERNGWAIVLYLLGSAMFPVLYGILRH